MSSADMPIACCLSDAELREREAGLLARLRSVIEAADELHDGYALRLPGDGESLRLVVDIIAAERECCPFLRFELIAEPGMGPLTLRITGPAQTKEFLKNVVLGSYERGAAAHNEPG